MNRLAIEAIPKPYSIDRQFVATFGISHLAYGRTPQECITNLEALIEKLRTTAPTP
jgi:hypothetical protein